MDHPPPPSLSTDSSKSDQLDPDVPIVDDTFDPLFENDLYNRPSRGNAVYLTEDFEIPQTRGRGATAAPESRYTLPPVIYTNRTSISALQSPRHEQAPHYPIPPPPPTPPESPQPSPRASTAFNVNFNVINNTPPSTQNYQNDPLVTPPPTAHNNAISHINTPTSPYPQITQPMPWDVRISEHHFGPTNQTAQKPTIHLDQPENPPNLHSPTNQNSQQSKLKPNLKVMTSPSPPNTPTASQISTSSPSPGDPSILSNNPLHNKNLYHNSHKLALEQLKRHSVYRMLSPSGAGFPASPKPTLPKTQIQSVPYIPTLFDPENGYGMSSKGTANLKYSFTDDDLYNISQLHSQHYINGLKLWTVSINMGAHDIEGSSGQKYKKEVAQSLPALFPPGMDIYVLAVQEGKGEAIADLVNRYLSEHYDVFQLPNCFPMVEGRGDGSFISTKYTGIVSFARRSLMPFISIVGSVPYSLGITQGSKGGACLALMVFGMTFLFIGVHLPANSLSGRLDSITNILANCTQKMFPTLQGFEATNIFHNVFFMGDTNFKMQISDLDALNCIYDQGIKNKQNGWFKPLGDSGLLPTALPSSQSLNSSSEFNIPSQLSHLSSPPPPPPPQPQPQPPAITSPSQLSIPLFPTSTSCLQSNLSHSGQSPLPQLAQYDRSFGLSWMYAMDELTNAHKQYNLLSAFSEPLPSPLLFPTYKRIEGTVLANPHDSSEIKSIFRTRFKEAFYKGGNVVVRVPAFTDRIIYTSLMNSIHPLRYSTQNPSNSQNLYHSSFQYQRSVLPQSDITNHMIFLKHKSDNLSKLYKTFTVSQKLVNQPKYISSLSMHHSQLIPQRAVEYSNNNNNDVNNTIATNPTANNPTSDTPFFHPLTNIQLPPPPPDDSAIDPTNSLSKQLSLHTLPNHENSEKQIFNPRVGHLPHTCDIYSCIETLTFSDHRPVVAGFQCAIPAIYMPTILSYMEHWIKEQQQLSTPPPPPPPPPPPLNPSQSSEDDDISSSLTTQPLLSPTKHIDLNKSVFFPPLPTLRPFPRQSLLWLEPPLTLLTNAIKSGIFCFRIMASNLQLLIPQVTSRSQATAIPLLTSNHNYDLLSSLSHQKTIIDIQPGNTMSPSPSSLHSAVLSETTQLTVPAPPHSSNFPTNKTFKTNFNQNQSSTFSQHQQTSSTNKFGTFSSLTQTSQSINHTTVPPTPTSTNTPGGTLSQQDNSQIPTYKPRNHGDLLNTSKIGKEKSGDTTGTGGAYSTQSKISKNSNYKPMKYQDPLHGSPLMSLIGFDSQFKLPSNLSPSTSSPTPSSPSPPVLLDQDYREMSNKELLNISTSMNNDVPIMIEYSYSAHPIDFAKMLFPAPLEHLSIIPRIQTLHRHTSVQSIATTVVPANYKEGDRIHQLPPSSPQQPPPPLTQPTSHQNQPTTMYHYATIPHGSSNDLALATTTYNSTTNIAKIPILQLSYPIPSLEKEQNNSFASTIHQNNAAVVLQPLSQQGRQFYSNSYPESLFSLPIKHLKGRFSNTINASFETNNPYVYSTIHCCFSLDLGTQREQETEQLKQLQQEHQRNNRTSIDNSTPTTTVTASGKYQQFNTGMMRDWKEKDKNNQNYENNNQNIISYSNNSLNNNNNNYYYQSNQHQIDLTNLTNISNDDDDVFDQNTRLSGHSMSSIVTNDLSTDSGLSNAMNQNEHPFSMFPNIVQANLQLSLFDFLYSSKFLTTGLENNDNNNNNNINNNNGNNNSSVTAQQPITVDVPIFSGGSLVTHHGLPLKLRLNVNPYYAIRQPNAIFND
jgi:hypothetical protein